MPIYQLSEQLIFPNPLYAEDGVLAVGGDLSPQRLLLAYRNGIFPWYNEDEPIIWHAPDPRFVLFPEKFYCSKSLKRLVKQEKFTVKVNTNFEAVIKNCKQVEREDQDGTWITNEMEQAYINLHQLGFAHSIEVYNSEEKLVGGLYGLKIGQVFFGESMFHLESNASKFAFHYLVNQFDVKLIDCQVYTEHLESLGAEDIKLTDFLELLNKYCE